MFYTTDTNRHGLPHDPFKSCTVPRPIGWLSTLGADGVVNVAPYSFCNAVASDPPMVMYASNGQQAHGAKDTLTNIETQGEFVFNVATYALREQLNQTSLGVRPEVDEMQLAGLTAAASTVVAPPRIAESPINLECVLEQVVELPAGAGKGRNALVIGRVVGIHIDESVLTDGLIDMAKLEPIARLGYQDYAVVREVFRMVRPVKA